MALFNQPTENRIKCGRCNTEFDLNKNSGCPLCGFGGKAKSAIEPMQTLMPAVSYNGNYLAVPKEIKSKPGKVTPSKESRSVGSWGMFNSFFPGKAVLRILANYLSESKQEYMQLDKLLNTCSEVFKVHTLADYRGFPNDTTPDSSSMGRLVSHFIKTFTDMGFFHVRSKKGNDSIWNEDLSNIEITITKEGYEFAKLKNKIFDEGGEQILTNEERAWLLQYLKSIDSDYREYNLLNAVYKFIKSGNNGKDELWDWFKHYPPFVTYVKDWSRKTKDPVEFKKQISNLAPTFASAKIALLRELGVIRNKRNDYTIIGEFK